MNLGAYSLLVLAFTLMALGNGPAMLPFFQQSLIEEHRLLSTDQFVYAFAISQVTPGQANLFVTSVGYMLNGLGGALLGTLMMVLPAYLMLPLLGGYNRLKNSRLIRNWVHGMTTASIGLIWAATVEIASTSLRHPIGWVAFLGTLALTRVGHWKPLPSLFTASSATLVLLMLAKH
jgi:chromate transporter